MYSEKIDTIVAQINAIIPSVDSLIKDIIKSIVKVQDGATTPKYINIMYYTDRYATNYTFFGLTGRGYGESLSIGGVDISNPDHPIFNMVTDFGDDFEDRTLDDFNISELVCVAMLLNSVLDVVNDEGRVVEEYEEEY